MHPETSRSRNGAVQDQGPADGGRGPGFRVIAAVPAALTMCLVAAGPALAGGGSGGWRDVIPWDSLDLPRVTQPGPIARAAIGVSRWLVMHLVPITLILGIGVLGAVALALLTGLTDREAAVRRFVRVFVAIALVALVASGVVVGLIAAIGTAVERAYTG